MRASTSVLASWPGAAFVVDSAGTIVAASPGAAWITSDAAAVRLQDVLEPMGELVVGSRWRARIRDRRPVAMVQADIHPAEDGVLVACTDVTEVHCRAEHLSDLFQHAPDAFIVVDRRGVIQFANDQAGVMFKRHADALTGTAVETLIPARFRAGHGELRDSYAAHARVRPMGAKSDLFAVDADGNEFPVEISLAPIGDPEEGLFGAALRDVTQSRRQRIELQQAVQRLEHANHDLEAFAARAAHDLRAPLRHIRSFVQMVGRSTIADENARKWLSRVEDNAGRLDGLIDGLLELSGVGREESPPADVDLAALCFSVLEERLDEVEAAGARVTVEGLPTVEGDARLLHSLFANLIGNALRYRRPGTEPVVRISAQQEEDAWYVTVQDNGLGIDDDARERVFEPFERAHSHAGGHGIGLALCRRIMELHGGSIVAAPSEEGACIQCRFPVNPWAEISVLA